jgi:hypothetical protein
MTLVEDSLYCSRFYYVHVYAAEIMYVESVNMIVRIKFVTSWSIGVERKVITIEMISDK